MERTNRSDVGDIKPPTYRGEYNVTQTSATEDHVTYLARGKYSADQPIRDEDNATTRVNIENGSRNEPIKYQEFYTSTPTDDSMMWKVALCKFFSPRPYSKSISPIAHVTWNQQINQQINDRFLRHPFDDFPDHTHPVDNSLTIEITDMPVDHEENETHMADVLEERADELENIINNEHNASGDWTELEQLKKAYEEILMKKEQIDELVERQQLALEEQDRILEDVMQIARAEHDGMEKVAGEFANKMKTYTHFKEETTNQRLYHKEVEIQADILHEENEELAKELSGLVFNINEIEERRHIGLKSFKAKTEEMKCVAEQMKEDNDRLESDIKKKVEEFGNLRMELNDRGIPYVSERKPVQVNGIKTKKTFPSIEENSLKINIESLIGSVPTIDTARYERSQIHVLEQVTMTSDKELEKEVTGKANLNAGSGDNMELSNDKGSEKVQDLDKDADSFEINTLETELRTEGSGDEVELCYDKGSERMQDLDKDVDDFEEKCFEMKTRIEGSGSEVELCYHKGSDKVHDLDKDVDDFEKKALEMKLRIAALSSDLDTLLAQEGFAEERYKDDDTSDTKILGCYERQCMGDEINLTNKNNTSQKHYPKKLGFENNLIEIETDKSCQEKLNPTKQLSAVELVCLPGKRDKKTKIPKPMFHPYGSAVIDGERHVVSKKSTSVVVLRDDYDRKPYVPEDQRNVFEAVVGYLSAEREIQPPNKYQSPLACKPETKRFPVEIEQMGTLTKINTGTLNWIRNGEIKSKINTGQQNILRRPKDDSQNTKTVNLPKDENQSLKKSLKTKPPEKVNKPCKPQKSEIKPKIDTGLNALKQNKKNTVQKKAKPSKQNKLQPESHVQKDSTAKEVSHAKSKIDRSAKQAVSRTKPKSKQLPPIKMVKKESDTGKTVKNCCNDEIPLPKIKPARKQDEHELTSINKIPNKQERANSPLPPIGRSPTSRHGSDYKVNISICTPFCDSVTGTKLSPVTHSVDGKLPLVESEHVKLLTKFADPFISPNLSPSERLSPPIAKSPTKVRLNPEPEVIPLHRKHLLGKSTVHVQQREPAVMWHLFSPSPPQSPPPSSRRLSSRRSCNLRNMPILANSPTTDPDRKPHSRA